MDAGELARWTRFAAKGGIGKCTAIQDCIAESPDDLMFMKDDEITVLMQLPDQDGVYLGFCEDVVGHFHGPHVQFHSKLKKPIMTKRSSMSARQSSTPTFKSPSPMSMSEQLMPRRSSVAQSTRSSRQLSEDEVTSPPAMSYSSSSTISDVGLPTPPLPLQLPFKSTKRDIPSPAASMSSNDANSRHASQVRVVPTASSSRVTSPLSIPQEESPPQPTFSPVQDPSPQESSFSIPEPSPQESSFSDNDGPLGNRASIAMSDGEVGIGLSLLQDMIGGDADDWSSTSSRYSTHSLVQTPEPMERTSDASEEHSTPQAGPSSASTSSTSVGKGSPEARRLTKHSDDWEGASDIYDDYRYSRFSLASKASQGSHARSTTLPPVPDTKSTHARSSSVDSDASVYTQASRESSIKGSNTLSVQEPGSKNRPTPLDLEPSPLLHTTWGGSSTSSPSPPFSSSSFFSPGIGSPSHVTTGAATAPRQRIEIDRSTPSPQFVEAEVTPIRRIVVEDDEELPSHVVEESYSTEGPSLDSLSVPAPSRVERQASEDSSESLTPPASPLDLALPPPESSAFPPSARPAPPSLSELRGYAAGANDDAGGSRTSLFLPHPNAPKPTTSSAGPMYIRGGAPGQRPPMPNGINPAAVAINTIRLAMSGPPRPGPHGPTIYGKVEIDLSSSTGPVPILFSVDPPPITQPTRAQASSPLKLSLVPPVPYDSPRARRGSIDQVPSSPIPRANFFPKAGTARPRSRSFSAFNSSSPTSETGSTLDGVPSLGIPRSPSSPLSPPAAPVITKSASSSKLRAAHAPSPLSLPQNNLRGTNVVGKPGTAAALPTLRQTTSRTNLNNSPLSPTPIGRPEVPASPPRVLHKQQSLQTNLASPGPVADADNASIMSSRSRVASPPLIGRQPSLRSKLSLPNMRRSQSRHGSISSGLEAETVQVADMDFQLIRPTIPQRSRRDSEESSIMGRDASIDARSNIFTRTASPAISISSGSGPLSPSVSDGTASAWKSGKNSEAESSMESHRQRELKWMSLMSAVAPSQSRKNKKVRKLVMEGVPSSVRYLVWSHLMDGKARNVPGIYAQLSQRARVAAFGDMERDVRKCFADHPQLLSTQGPLISVLQAYLTMVPDLQYSTGLTLIAGHLLLLAPEEDAFWTFVSIMDTYLRSYFSSNNTQLEVDSALFARALEANDTQVSKKVLIDMSMPPNKICHPWFSTLFVGTLSGEYLNRVWDLFLCEGLPFLIRVGLAIIYCCRRHLLACPTEDAVLNCLKRPSPTWLPPSADAFITLAFSMKLKDDDVRKQRIKMEAQVKRQTQQAPRNGSGAISLPR